MSERNYDVAIVGLGPVGALTAILLAEEGLRVSVLERSTEPVVLPRAVGLDGESVRAFQRIGRGEAIEAILQPPRERDEVCFTDSKQNRLFGQDIPPHGPMGWREMAFFDQPELEALLREFVAEYDRIDVSLGSEVTALAQDSDGVRVTTRPADAGGEEEALRAAYVIGCDGASSFVRGAADIGWQSLGYDQDWLVIDITIGPEADLPLATMQVCDPERLTTYVCVKDPNRRWEFQLRPGETRDEMLRPEKIESLLDDWLPREHYEIRRAAVYQFHAATADRWRDGRILLAGDAAHQTPPFLGQGLNAGFRDAVNLGWKIPLVLSGACDATLLDTYAEERDAHARDLVEGAVSIGMMMETLAAREVGRPDPHEGKTVRLPFGQRRMVPSLRSGAFVESQVTEDGIVGALLRQPTVRTPAGEEVRLDELLGRGFAVIGRKQGDLRMGEEAARVLERLGGRTLALEGLTATVGEHDFAFDSHPALVLRPDRHVFGVVDGDWDLDRLLAELARKLRLV